jgi:hypothetical protein
VVENRNWKLETGNSMLVAGYRMQDTRCGGPMFSVASRIQDARCWIEDLKAAGKPPNGQTGIKGSTG